MTKEKELIYIVDEGLHHCTICDGVEFWIIRDGNIQCNSCKSIFKKNQDF